MRIDEGLQRLVQGATRVAVLTGAGISAESGVPTFREARSGFWERFDPEELATPEAFARNPRKVWSWYAQRREQARWAEASPAHRALAQWEQLLEWCCVVTQNVDGLHQRAGSSHVIELHGNIHRDRRFQADTPPAEDLDGLPRCPETGALLRPDVVWFGERLPEGALEAAREAMRSADLVLSVGTSALVQPAASLPLEALERDIPVVEINREPTPLTPVADWVLQGEAGEVLPQLVAAAGDGAKRAS